MRMRRGWRTGAVVGVATALGVLAPAGVAAAHQGTVNEYKRTDLVSDQPGTPVVDPALVNAWGLSAGPVGPKATPLWVANNNSDSSTLYRAGVTPNSLVKVPLKVAIPGGAPTGTVYNPTAGFVVSTTDHKFSGSALFLFASENGDITGWSPAVPPPFPSTQAQAAVHESDAVFKGLTLATNDDGTFLFAANFHEATVEVFDTNFHRVSLEGGFVDHKIPDGYAPFGIQELGGKIYVTYAKQNPAEHDDLSGHGHGFVNVFDTEGHLLKRLVRRGSLDSPWGLAQAPSSFGKFSNDLLVGNFGDGLIHAYDINTGAFRGTLRDDHHDPIVIDGLWGLRFGNGVDAPTTTLLFAAGPVKETHGLLGTIIVE